jgi:dTDP-glucose pyrophosphorylase
MDETKVERAVLLAAGRGTRLGALTADRPKPMVPVAGKPVLERILEAVREAGPRRFLLVVGYRREAIQEYFKDGSAWGVEIDYRVQEVPNGTGSALREATDWAEGAPVLMSYGDILTDPAHYRALLDDFQAAPCGAVIGINPVDDPTAGAAVYRDGRKVTRVVEKPPPGTAESNWNVGGVNVFGPEVWPALARIQPSKRGEYELTDAISLLIDEPCGVRAVEMRGFWSDIGTPEMLAEAERHLREV